jgi:hypothetical protein
MASNSPEPSVMNWEIDKKYTYKVSKAGEDIVYPSKLLSLYPEQGWILTSSLSYY